VLASGGWTGIVQLTDDGSGRPTDPEVIPRMAKDYVFTPPPNWPAPPRGWTPPPGWTPDPEWGPAPDGWDFWTRPESGGSWIARHTVLTGVGATVAVIGTVVAISAFANGSDNQAPVAATTSSASLLTAVQDTSGPESLPEASLSDSVTQSPSQTTSTTSRPTTSSSTTSSPSPTTSTSTTTSSPSPTRPVRVYVSCRGMNRDHPHGVGLAGATDVPRQGQQEVKEFEVNPRLYQANQFLDRDGDRIACER
jgi:Excalibur calcium-binding domain